MFNPQATSEGYTDILKAACYEVVNLCEAFCNMGLEKCSSYKDG